MNLIERLAPPGPRTPAKAAPMNLNGLTSLARNKTVLIGGGAVLVAVFAFGSRSKGEDTGSGTNPATSPQDVSAYTSEASDVYNALQPQIESVADALDQLNANSAAAGKPPSATVPTPVLFDTRAKARAAKLAEQRAKAAQAAAARATWVREQQAKRARATK